MLIRISRTVALAAGLLLAAIGILIAPGAALGGLILAVLVAAGTVAHVRGLSDSPSPASQRRSRRIGLAAGGATVAVWLVITGLVALLGPAFGAILLAVLIPASVIWLWRRFPAGFLAPQPPPVSPAELSTKALCVAWQRSQRSLLVARTAPAQREIVCTRQRLLDEMERRDSAGFDRWLADGACNGTDPGRYLSIDR